MTDAEFAAVRRAVAERIRRTSLPARPATHTVQGAPRG